MSRTDSPSGNPWQRTKSKRTSENTLDDQSAGTRRQRSTRECSSGPSKSSDARRQTPFRSLSGHLAVLCLKGVLGRRFGSATTLWQTRFLQTRYLKSGAVRSLCFGLCKSIALLGTIASPGCLVIQNSLVGQESACNIASSLRVDSGQRRSPCDRLVIASPSSCGSIAECGPDTSDRWDVTTSLSRTSGPDKTDKPGPTVRAGECRLAPASSANDLQIPSFHLFSTPLFCTYFLLARLALLALLSCSLPPYPACRTNRHARSVVLPAEASLSSL